MNRKIKKTIGILGGMGPEATAYFFELIIKNTRAEKDQDHIHILIDNCPQIPPRTDAILGTGPSPVPLLLKGTRNLKRAGADFIVVPCITAHYFFPQFVHRTDIPFIDLIQETIRHVNKSIPDLAKAGLIASTGTLKSGIFQKAFGKKGIEIIEPSAREQEKVMESIFGPKGIKAGFIAGESKKNIKNIAGKLIKRGAEAVIAGCTEVPLVLRDNELPVPLIEPMLIGALAGIVKAGYETKNEP